MAKTHRSMYHRHEKDDTRMTNVMIRFTPAEKEEVRTRAKSVGYPMAAYIRETAIGHARSLESSSIKSETIRRLADIGNELRMLRKGGGYTDVADAPTLESLLARILTVIEDVEHRRHA